MKNYVNKQIKRIKSGSKSLTAKSIHTIKGSLLIKSIKKVNAIGKVPLRLVQLNAPILNQINKLDPRKLPFLKTRNLKNKNTVKLPELSSYDIWEEESQPHSSHLIPVISEQVGKFKNSKQQLRFGETLHEGALMGYIEALGIKHPIYCPAEGLLEKKHINSGEMVGYGQLLFEILEDTNL